jgi:hypothetical protein
VCQLDTSLSTYIARSYAALEELDWNTADHYLVNAVHAGLSKWWTLPDVNGWPQQPLMQVRGDVGWTEDRTVVGFTCLSNTGCQPRHWCQASAHGSGQGRQALHYAKAFQLHML